MAFIYCPNCKKNLSLIVNRRIDCKHCGFVFYFSPALTNGAIIENKKGEILLVKRKFPPKKGFWDVAGGFVDYNENFEQSLIREVKEELGVEMTDLKYFASGEDRYLFKGVNYHTICVFFTGKIDGEKFVPADDISDYKFFPKDKIPYSRLAFKNLIKAIKDYQAQ